MQGQLIFGLLTLSLWAIGSQIGTGSFEGAEGDSGRLSIKTSRLTLNDEAIVTATTFGRGNAGEIDIQATDSITLRNSQIQSAVGDEAEGNANAITIATSTPYTCG